MDKLYEEMAEWAKHYIKGFYNDNEDIQHHILIKEEHTGYVVKNCEALADKLGFSEHERQLARMVGLFHDIGRFEQYTKYQTFNDRLSENHALLGLKVIAKLPFLQELSCEDRKIFEFAISNHNARVIEPTSDERALQMAKLIRDADKLDIYRVLEPMIEPSDGTGCSEEFLNCLLEGRQGDYTYIKTLDDRKIVRLLWAYDIYFSWTMQQIIQKGYIDKIAECLPQDVTEIRLGLTTLHKFMHNKAIMNND